MNGKRFVYFYFNRNEPEKIKQVVSAHDQYWKSANVKGCVGGPFGDKTSELISFFVPGFPHATEIILQDPFIREDLVEQK
jgi:hypothetical protein